MPSPADPPTPTPRDDNAAMMSELRSMKGLIEDRFGALAFMEKLQRQPRQAQLTQKLLDCGFSPALIRKLADSLPADAATRPPGPPACWSATCAPAKPTPRSKTRAACIALIGATGVGKTTTHRQDRRRLRRRATAPRNLGLITLDAYRVGAHEQLRAYGRILGVPVHTAHDRASLEDLLELLAAKKMVLIDTAGMAQRDSRTRELLDMLSHRSIQRCWWSTPRRRARRSRTCCVAYRAGELPRRRAVARSTRP